MSEAGPSSSTWKSPETYAQIGEGATSIGTGIMGIISMMKESAQSRSARHAWENMQQPAANLFGQLYNNPSAQGVAIPYGKGSTYNWAPTQATQNLYANYLNRQYGMSRGTAQAMTAQALKPVALNQLRGGASSAAAYGGSRINAQALANAAMGTQQAGVMRSQNYLQNAGKLAAYNLWRAQQLGQTIG